MKKLEQLLEQIHRKSYPAYKSLRGSYQFPEYTLYIEHVQGDPFAAPSKLSVLLKNAGFPKDMYDEKHKRVALQDYLLRSFYQQTERYSKKAKGSGKSGVMKVSRCGQEVLERTGCEVDAKNGSVRIRLEIGFPANGRTINSFELKKILYEYLPECVSCALFYKNTDKKRVENYIQTAENQEYIRRELKNQGLLAFVAKSAILPRESGVKQTPMRNAVPFQSPSEQEISLELPYGGEIQGMGIKKGITLIVGGGYHGKSTLLQALERGVYNHIPGDGREYVITDADAVKIRAEDGRSICNTDIRSFIHNLPNKKDTEHFCTEDASGSTSQAANVMEAVEAGGTVLLIDEDTSATNFMVRDELMQRVVNRDKEPIIPFVDRARELVEQYHVSTIMVAGSSGSYFHIADTILQMDEYVPRDITAFAKEEAKAFPITTSKAKAMSWSSGKRVPETTGEFRKEDRIKMRTTGTDSLSLNHEDIRLSLVEQLVDGEQVNALGYLLIYLETQVYDGKRSLEECVKFLMEELDTHGFSKIIKGSVVPGNLAYPRKEEISACVNRYRKLKIKTRK